VKKLIAKNDRKVLMPYFGYNKEEERGECWMRLKIREEVYKRRRLNAFGPVGGSMQFGAHDRDVITAARGVYTRIFVCKTRGAAPWYPTYDALRDKLRPFTQALRKRAFTLVPWSFDRFIASYHGLKQTRYRNAVESLFYEDLEHKDSICATFVKMEKLPFSKKPDPDPRVIQPRSDRFHVSFGVYIRPLEAVLFKAVAKIFTEVTIFKGLNAFQQGQCFAQKWAQYTDPVAIGLDAIRQDQHMSPAMLLYMAMVYQWYYNSPELAQLLEWQRVIKGVMRDATGTLKYKKIGGGASGDMDTSLRSCIVSVAIVGAFMFPTKLKFSLANNGDDNVIIMERADMGVVDGLPAFSAECGFPLTTDPPVYQLEHIEFCKTRPVFDGQHWCMVRDPRVCLSKDLTSVKPFHNEKAWNTLRNSVGLCGQSLAGHMPIYTEFYKMLCRNAGTRVDKDATESGFTMLARGMRNDGVVTSQARVSFWQAFQITPAEQVALEAYYASVDLKWSTPSEVELYSVPPHIPLTSMGSAV
jgi:hypothetical protein